MHGILVLVLPSSRFVTIDCDSPFDTVVTLSGTKIISPNYPLEYEMGKDCEITVRFFGRVRITFLTFDVESYDSCLYDHLEFFDGPTSSSRRIGKKLCGSTRPNPIESTGMTLHMKFHTDSSRAKTGFKVQVDEGKHANRYNCLLE